MKKQFAIFYTVALAFMNVNAQAQNEVNARPLPPPGMMPLPVQGLNLTQEQKSKFAEMRKKHHGEMVSLREAVEQKREAFEKLFASSASEADLRKAHAELQELTQKMMAKHFENSLEIRAQLSPAQRTEMMQKMGQHKGDFSGPSRGLGNGMGRGMHHGGGMGQSDGQSKK